MSYLEKVRLSPQNIRHKGPFSYGMRIGNAIHIHGQMGTDFESKTLVDSDVKKQTIQIFENIECILQSTQCTLNQVVGLTIYLKDLNHRRLVDQMIALYFNSPYPTVSVVAVLDLEHGASVMMDCIAYDTREFDEAQMILEDDCGGSRCQD